MKPKHLKFPHTWEERRPALVDRVLFVPEHYDKHRDWPMPSWREIFGNDNPVAVEYCSGNGTWIAEKARLEPHLNWIAVEWRFDRVRKIWSKVKNYGLPNLLTVCGQAEVFAHDYLPEKSISSVFINFPDPWPKLKHAKHRLFQAPFIADLARTMAGKGAVTAVTDDAAYGEQIVRELLANAFFTSSFPEPYFVTDWPGYGESYFDNLWRGKGRQIRYFRFEKQ